MGDGWLNIPVRLAEGITAGVCTDRDRLDHSMLVLIDARQSPQRLRMAFLLQQRDRSFIVDIVHSLTPEGRVA